MRPYGGRQDRVKAGRTVWRQARQCGGRQDHVKAGKIGGRRDFSQDFSPDSYAKMSKI